MRSLSPPPAVSTSMDLLERSPDVPEESARCPLITQFPVDLLSEIFRECAERDSDHKWNPVTDPEWQLSRVCRVWRAVSFGMPLLWRRIYIAHSYAFYDQLSLDALEALLLLHLERSAQVPLSVCFTAVDTSAPSETRAKQRRLILGALFSVASRWRDVELHISAAELLLLQANVTAFPQLRMLDFSVVFWERGFKFPNVFENAPLLEQLRYTGGDSCMPSLRDIQTLPWLQIQKLSLSNHKRVDSDLFSLLNVFQLASNVVDIKLSSCFQCTPTLVPFDLITLSHLRSLTLQYSDDFFMHYLGAPVLERLKIEQLSRYSHISHVLAFLMRSAPPLTHLVLVDLEISRETLVSILELVPHAHMLVLQDLGHAINASLVRALTCGPGELNLVPEVARLELAGYFTCTADPLVYMLRSRCAPSGPLRSARFSKSGESIRTDLARIVHNEGLDVILE